MIVAKNRDAYEGLRSPLRLKFYAMSPCTRYTGTENAHEYITGKCDEKSVNPCRVSFCDVFFCRFRQYAYLARMLLESPQQPYPGRPIGRSPEFQVVLILRFDASGW
jgi:hypothetical protein